MQSIVFVAEELAPWTGAVANARRSGASFWHELLVQYAAESSADLARELPRAVKAQGLRVLLVLPYTREFEEESGLMLARRLSPVTATDNTEGHFECHAYDGRLSSQVELLLVARADGGELSRTQLLCAVRSVVSSAPPLDNEDGSPASPVVIHVLGKELSEATASVKLGEEAVYVTESTRGAFALDATAWSPATATELYARFDAENHHGKTQGKAAFLRTTTLGQNIDEPLLAISAPALPEEALLALLNALLLRTSARVLCIGFASPLTGDLATSRVFSITKPNKVEVHRALAAADAALLLGDAARLVPICQRYGTLPVAETGIIDCDASLITGTGFQFDGDTPTTDRDTLAATMRALGAISSSELASARAALIRRVMRLDYGWDRLAHRFVRRYRLAAASTTRVLESTPRDAAGEATFSA
jgi:hypothetical protein